jgi:hypothetical protein
VAAKALNRSVTKTAATELIHCGLLAAKAPNHSPS